jgi:hypothetical protein
MFKRMVKGPSKLHMIVVHAYGVSEEVVYKGTEAEKAKDLYSEYKVYSRMSGSTVYRVDWFIDGKMYK